MTFKGDNRVRTLVTLVLTVITLIFLLFGYSYWKGQTNLSVKEQTQTNNDVKEPTKETEENNDLSLLDRVGKWPEHAVDDYRHALENGQPFKFAIVGSQVLAGEDGWAEQLKDEFKNVFNDTITVEIFQFDDVNSTDFLADDVIGQVKDYEPQFMLLEGFSLNDNGVVPDEQKQENLTEILDTFSDTTVIVQPSHPIFNANRYATEVDNQEAFISNAGFVYLNHWSAWPDYTTEEFHTYMGPNQSYPSERGNEVWFNYLKEYFFQ